jgi:hypothetical protein
MVGVWLLVAVLAAAPAAAQSAEAALGRGTVLLSLQAGGGAQNNVEGHRDISDASFLTVTPRLGWIPFDPVGPGILRGALEVGLEGWYQRYVEPGATAAGLKLAGRYHFVGLGALAPYVEVLAGAGGTDLEVREIRSDFTFVLEAGVGLSYFLQRNLAVNVGYRFQHISNGNVESPNRGFNSDAGVLGVTYLFH